MAAEFGAQLIEALEAGRRRKQDVEDRQIQKMLHELELKRLKTLEVVEPWRLKREAAQHQFEAQQGQPAANFTTTLQNAPSELTGGAMAPMAPDVVPTGPKPVDFPGLPEMAIPSYQQTPQTMEQLLLAQQQAARKKEFSSGVTLGPGQVRMFGGEEIARGPERPTPAEPTVSIATMENGQRVTKVLPRSQAAGQTFPSQPPAATQGAMADTDPRAIADAIINGDQPPDLQGLYRYGAPVRTALAKAGYNLTKAKEDWQATQKYLATLNGQQQVRLRQAVSFTKDSLDLIEDLAKQWKGGKFPLLNRAALLAAKNGAMGQNAAAIATKLEAQIADLVSELGTVYKGGNSSTDESLKLAAQNLKSDWSESVLIANLSQVRKNLQIRENSIRNGAPIGNADNPYAPTTAAPVTSGTVKMRAPDGSTKDIPKDQVEHYKSLGAVVIN
jgi:hypothetical protein